MSHLLTVLLKALAPGFRKPQIYSQGQTLPEAGLKEALEQEKQPARPLLETKITFIFSRFGEDVWASVGVVRVRLGMHVCVRAESCPVM